MSQMACLFCTFYFLLSLFRLRSVIFLVLRADLPWFSCSPAYVTDVVPLSFLGVCARKTCPTFALFALNPLFTWRYEWHIAHQTRRVVSLNFQSCSVVFLWAGFPFSFVCPLLSSFSFLQPSPACFSSMFHISHGLKPCFFATDSLNIAKNCWTRSRLKATGRLMLVPSGLRREISGFRFMNPASQSAPENGCLIPACSATLKASFRTSICVSPNSRRSISRTWHLMSFSILGVNMVSYRPSRAAPGTRTLPSRCWRRVLHGTPYIRDTALKCSPFDSASSDFLIADSPFFRRPDFRL